MEIFGIGGLILVFIALCSGVVILEYICRRYKIPVYICMIVCIVGGYVCQTLAPMVLHQLGIVSPVSNPELQQIFDLGNIYVQKNDIHNAAAFGWQEIIYTSETWEHTSSQALYGVTAHEKGHLVYQHVLWKLFYLGCVGGFLIYIWRYYLRSRPVYLRYIILCVLCMCRGLGYIQIQIAFERQADRYTIQHGYASGLIEYFETASAYGQGGRMPGTEFLYLHEPLQVRIEKLRKYVRE